MGADAVHWAAAIGLYLIGSFLAAMGINTMKYAMDTDEAVKAAKASEGAPLLGSSQGAAESDESSGFAATSDTYSALEANDDSVLGASKNNGSASVVDAPRGMEKLKTDLAKALTPRRDRCRCCCDCAYSALGPTAGAVLDIVMWPARLFPLLWYVGIASLLLGQVFVFPSFALANQSVLCTLGSVQFPLNLLFVVVVLKARPPLLSWIGVGLIVIGDSLVVGFSKNSDKELNVEALQSLWTDNAENQIYLVVLFSVGALCFVLSFVFQLVAPRVACLAKLGGVDDATLASARSGNEAAAAEDVTKTLAASNVVGFFFALSSAIFGSQCMTFVKSVMEVASIAVGPCVADPNNACPNNRRFDGLVHVYFYLCIAVVLGTGIWWGVRLNMALARFNQVFIVSMMQVSWTLTTVMDGGMYFKEFDAFERYNYVAFIGGLALILCGVLLLGVGGDGLEESGTATVPVDSLSESQQQREAGISLHTQRPEEARGGQ